MSTEPKITYSGPTQTDTQRFEIGPGETRTWIFPDMSGYFLSDEEYHDFKAMQKEWKERLGEKP